MIKDLWRSRSGKGKAVVAVVALLVALFALAQLLPSQSPTSGDSPTRSAPPVTSTTPGTNVPPDGGNVPPDGSNTGDTAGVEATRRDPQAAVKAAATITDVLARAIFQDDTARRLTIDAVAVPGIRDELNTQLSNFAPQMAQLLGYSTVADANEQSEATTVTSKYRIDSFSPNDGTAKIRLYVISQMNESSSSSNTAPQRRTPGITIISLKWQDGDWLYAGTETPPPSEVPNFSSTDVGLSFDEISSRYEPFLKSGKFKDYDQG